MTQQVQQIAPHEVQKKLGHAPVPVVVDVRTPAETLEGTIAGALLIPLAELQARAAELPADREVICVCKTGMRSANAAAFLRQRGLAAMNMTGGMAAWATAGLPVSK